MRSSFAGFTTAQLAMRASQKALDVTGQNIANINTKGYTRQRLDLISFSTGRGVSKYESSLNVKVGSGVLTKGLSQIRDPFLDIRYRNEVSNAGTQDQKLAVLKDLEIVFDEVTKNGIQNQISDISNMLQKLSSEVGNSEFDNLVKSSSDVLTKMFNEYAKQLENVRTEYETNLNIDVTNINDIIGNIHRLNDTIKVNQTHGNSALELQDQRNSLIDELSGYMKIDVKYRIEQITDQVSVEVPVISLVGKSGKIPLIDGNYKTELKIEKMADGKTTINMTMPDIVQPSEPPVVVPQPPQEITEEITAGTMKGTLDMLNKSGEFDAGTETTRGIGYYQKSLDILASKFSESFNELNKEYVYDKDGNQITGISTDADGITTFKVKNKNTGIETSFTMGSSLVDKFDENGNIIDNIGQDQTKIPITETVIDEYGNPITKIVMENVFDKDGNQITKIVTDAEGKSMVTIKDKITGVETSFIPESTIVPKFDRNGNVVDTLGQDEFLIPVKENVFDKDGNQIIKVVTDAEGRSMVTTKDKNTGAETSYIPVSTLVDKFDKNGNIITTLGQDEVQFNGTENVYDKDGNQITKIVTDADGRSMVTIKDKNTGVETSFIQESVPVDKFDKNGNVVANLAKDEVQFTVMENVLDKDGNQIVGIVTDADGRSMVTIKDKITGLESSFIQESKSVEKYDKNGDLVDNLTKDEFQIPATKNVYDKDGNRITQIITDAAGKSTVTIKDKITGLETTFIQPSPLLDKFDKNGKIVSTLGQDEFEIRKDLFVSNGGGTVTAKTIAISEGWNNGTIGITASVKYNSPLGSNDNILNMISSLSEKKDYKTEDGKLLFNGSYQEMFTNTGSMLALDIKSTTALLDNYMTISDEVANMRDNVSAVSLDEEGMNILHYQKSYNAAARLMTALDEALNTIINSMGIVGR